MISLNNFQLNDILGQEEVKKQVLSTLLTQRNIILVGPPGIGKTTLAKNIAKNLEEIEVNNCNYNCNPINPICPECKINKNNKTKKIKGLQRFIRVQGSPDLTVEDLFGDIDPIKALKFGPSSIQAFTPGKIFKANNSILFFDEINRCPEKLQNALLQALEEKKVTISSYEVEIPTRFILISTMNPDDFAGTEKLSEVFLDRFDIIRMSYPGTIEIEKQILEEKGKKLEKVKFPNELLTKTISFIHKLRHHKDIERAPSVRASLGLYERAQANALINKRNLVNIEDISSAIISVLSHRIRLKPSVKYTVNIEEFLKKEFEKGDSP